MVKYMRCIRHLGEGFCEDYMNTSKYAGEIAVVADIGEKFIYEIWRLMRIINLEYIQKQEKEYLCCGWDNAFDHCNAKFKLSLIYRWVVLEEHQDYLKSISPYFENNEDHNSGFDYYGGNSSDDSDSYRSYNEFESTFESSYKRNSSCEAFDRISEPEIFHSACYEDQNGEIVNVIDVCPNDGRMKNCVLDGCKKHFIGSIYQGILDDNFYPKIYAITVAYSVLFAVLIVAFGQEATRTLNKRKAKRRELRKTDESVPLTENRRS